MSVLKVDFMLLKSQTICMSNKDRCAVPVVGTQDFWMEVELSVSRPLTSSTSIFSDAGVLCLG